MATMTTLGRREVLGTAPVRRAPGRRRVVVLRVAAVLALVVPVGTAIVLRRSDWVLTSDSVAQQSIVRTWFAVGHDRTYVPPDTWILKLPVYLAVEALPLASAHRVLLESVLLAALTAVASAWAVWSLAGQAGLADARRRRDVVLVLAWVLTLSGGLGSYLVALPNSRNVELGLGLVLVAWTGRTMDGAAHGWRPSLRGLVGGAVVAVLLGVLWLDDPYVQNLVGWPLALWTLAWVVRPPPRGGRAPRLVGVPAVLLGSFAVVPVLRGLLATGGLVVVPDATAPTLD